VLCLAPSLCDFFLFMCALREGGTLSRAFSCYAVSPYRPTCLVPGSRACPLCIVPASSSRPPPQFVTHSSAHYQVTSCTMDATSSYDPSTSASSATGEPCLTPKSAHAMAQGALFRRLDDQTRNPARKVTRPLLFYKTRAPFLTFPPRHRSLMRRLLSGTHLPSSWPAPRSSAG
jgi:hypothetical protein